MTTNQTHTVPTSTHWGNYKVEVTNGRIAAIHPYEEETHPSPIGQSLQDSLDPGGRIPQPMVRAGYLQDGRSGGGAGRGAEPFVPVSWERALDLVAGELDRVKQDHGNESIYAGSYGWSSAGTLHRSQSQMQRFLNMIGGFTFHTGSYSLGAAHVILPHIIGGLFPILNATPSWQEISEHADLVVLFGGAPLKNAQIAFGGRGPYSARTGMVAAKASGVNFVNISPIRDDVFHEIGAEWIQPIPNSDTAVMLALAHTLVTEILYDQSFIADYCVGFDRFLPYLLGDSDGQPKDADWAAAISKIPAGDLRQLARRMAKQKTMISVSWSMQRAQHGEQPFWMATVLAALLGEIGLPGRGIAFGYNATHNYGSNRRPAVRWPSVDSGKNEVETFIPVSRIADMLLNPGQPFNFNGRQLQFPDIKMVLWAGGNPFHHHQDLNRLVEAWRRPETIVVIDPWWTATARHADIVLPATTALERNDINFNAEATITPMRQAVSPYQSARNDVDIFADLAGRFGLREAFTEGRDEMTWLRHFYESAIRTAAESGIDLPDFESFWLGEQLLVEGEYKPTLLNRFRDDPAGAPLITPSGKIEIFSETIDGFGYDDCPGHPTWMEPDEWLNGDRSKRFPLHLLSNQPKTRLHSQWDIGTTSRKSKIKGHEPARMNPQDAADRGLQDRDLIKLFNDRGACIAGVILSEDIRPGVVQLSTGAWYNPQEPGQIGSLELHGNPNVLTRDRGTSQLAQGSTAQTTLVQVERYDGPEVEITVFEQPVTAVGKG